MLLLLTGMETDLRLAKKARRVAISTSAAGIVVPFACGFALGELLPAAMLPNVNRRPTEVADIFPPKWLRKDVARRYSASTPKRGPPTRIASVT
jgi:hypothetical protein